MLEKLKFAVVGGDFRNSILVKMLSEKGFAVKNFALGDSDSKDYFDCATLEMALDDVDVVIAPIPFSTDGKTLNTPLHNEDIQISKFFKIISDKAFVIGGKFDEEIYKIAKYYSCKLTDILLREDFALLNAIPTAEGAIQIAMEETQHSINGSNIAIAGFGRIGKVLARMLMGMGANVYILSRSSSEIAYARSLGLETLEYKEIESVSKKLVNSDIIFNTVPKVVLTYDLLKYVKSGSLIIDLASKPGGVDFEKARELSLKTIWALSLPGKVAPITSAKIVLDTIINILKEMEDLK